MIRSVFLTKFILFCALFMFQIGCSSSSPVLYNTKSVSNQSMVNSDSEILTLASPTESKVSSESPVPEQIFAEIPKQPKIIFPQKSHNFGKVQPKTKLTYKFPFMNIGGAPLKIKHVRTSCGCTATNLGKKVLQPGESSELQIIYKTGKKLGRRRRNITIVSNDPVHPKVSLGITAEIQPAVTSVIKTQCQTKEIQKDNTCNANQAKTAKENTPPRIIRRSRYANK